ncbi:MAG: dihydrofolate reductase family protein [Planctomycetota bacterium]|nr:dihydrofolate reductase family protein [Planctomycetota bacterium]
MRKLSAFIQVSLDGLFAGESGDISWAHKPKDDAEWNAFVAGNASGGGALLFGRVTYEMMAGYWPSPMAAKNDPVVAERMNALPKFVVSRTLDKASWRNTTLIKGDLAAEIRKLKQSPGEDIAILGSGSLVAQLLQAGLLDGLQVVVNPLVLGKGRPLFAGVDAKIGLRLARTRAFANGSVVLWYEPGK